MKKLNISMGGEIKPVEDVAIAIRKRLLQVSGDLYEYNPLEDNDILRVSDVFLCLDQTGDYAFMINVVDKAQKISYTRKQMNNVAEIQVNQ
jgi:hypothetical protein